MCPFFNFNFLIIPKGNSKTLEYLKSQKKKLFGAKFSLNFTTLPLFVKTTTSNGCFIKNVCIPKRVLKNKAVDFFEKIAPSDFSLKLFNSTTCRFTERLSVLFVSTNLLYQTVNIKRRYNTKHVASS